jgi:nucleotide-binding universal stress UspA family protein
MHILLPTDGSDVALDAARRGLGVLDAPTQITLLSVVGDVPFDAGAGGIEGPVYTPEQEKEIRKSEHGHAERALDAAEALVQSVRPDSSIHRRIEIGDPAAVICLLAGQLGVDAVVVGSHGRGFLKRVLLGSVSEHVTRHAPCPVLVVRAAPEPK